MSYLVYRHIAFDSHVDYSAMSSGSKGIVIFDP